jgi:outer membrane protein TolC
LLTSINSWGGTLKSEISQAVDVHPKVATAKQKLTNAGIDVEVAEANYMPVVSVNGDLGEQDYKDTSSGIDSKGMNNNRYTLELRQNLFRGGKDQALSAQALVIETLAIKNFEDVYNDVLLEASEAYLDVLQYDQTRAVSEKKIELLEKYTDLIKKAKESGSKTHVDVYEAQLSLQQALGQKADIDGKFQSALSNYKTVFNQNADIKSMSLPDGNKAFVPESLDEAIEQAKNQSVKIAMAETNIENAESEKRIAKSEFWPTVDLVASLSEEKNREGIRRLITDKRVYIQIDWKINLGNQVSKKVQSASGKVTQERYNLDAVNQEVEQKVRLAWQKHAALKTRSQISEQTLLIANDVYDARKDLNKKGKGGAVAIIKSKLQLLDSTIEKLNANFEARKAEFALAKEIGTIKALLK